MCIFFRFEVVFARFLQFLRTFWYILCTFFTRGLLSGNTESERMATDSTDLRLIYTVFFDADFAGFADLEYIWGLWVFYMLKAGLETACLTFSKEVLFL